MIALHCARHPTCLPEVPPPIVHSILLSLVRLLVLAPFGGTVLVDHKRRETGTTPQEVAGAELVPAPCRELH